MNSMGCVKKALEEVQIGSTSELLEAAATNFRGSKGDDDIFMQEAFELLGTAIKNYNLASRKRDLQGEPTVTLKLQLAKAHALRGIAAYSDNVDHGMTLALHETAKYHLEQAAKFFVDYRTSSSDQVAAAKKLLQQAELCVKCCELNVPQLKDRITIVSSFDVHVLGGENSAYQGSRLSRVKLYHYLVHLRWRRTVQLLDSNTSDMREVFAELKRLQTTDLAWRVDSDSILKKWSLVKQLTSAASQDLRKAKLQLIRARDATPETGEHLKLLEMKHEELASTIRFYFHRSILLVDLIDGSEQWCKIFLGAEELDMEKCYQLVDRYVTIEAVALDLAKSGEDLRGFEGATGSATDIEIACITTHFLAKLVSAMGNMSKAREMHRRTILLGLSLDHTASDYAFPTSSLSSKAWFMESRHVVMQAQQADLEAERRAQEEALQEIKPELDALQAARNAGSRPNGEADDPRPLLRHLFEKHPPKTGQKADAEILSGTGSFPKKKLMKIMAYYHPDKLGTDPVRRDVLLYTEIQKLLNSIYEKDFKQ
eukprot:TRINITY_DN359_c0_g1_i2.p1 TRINITY_DN359_c0_g1~~TRINITY_DN359_c0_g1_i2.p1  ORF type:complete len:541 (+),score=145.36 TRINITY_DN359_c0_g1_i2:83-1705(+)